VIWIIPLVYAAVGGIEGLIAGSVVGGLYVLTCEPMNGELTC
jgi:hypothetical protein